VAAAVGGDQGGDIVAVGLIRLGDVVIGTSGVGDSLEAAQAVVVIVGPAHASGVGSAGDLTDGIAQVSQRHGVAGDQAQLAGPLAGEVLPRVVFVAPVPCRQRSGDGLEVPDGRVAVLPQLVRRVGDAHQPPLVGVSERGIASLGYQVISDALL